MIFVGSFLCFAYRNWSGSAVSLSWKMEENCLIESEEEKIKRAKNLIIIYLKNVFEMHFALLMQI